jgi:hypothetical protein
VAAAACLVPRCSALEFEMAAQTKCIFEELNANVIVVGDYKAANKDNPSVPVNVDVRVRVAVARRRRDSSHAAAVELLRGVLLLTCSSAKHAHCPPHR